MIHHVYRKLMWHDCTLTSTALFKFNENIIFLVGIDKLLQFSMVQSDHLQKLSIYVANISICILNIILTTILLLLLFEGQPHYKDY